MRLTVKNNEMESYYMPGFQHLEDNPEFNRLIDKMAKFENLMDFIEEEAKRLPIELEKLRGDGKVKTYHFRELLGEKMMNDAFVLLLAKFNIELNKGE